MTTDISADITADTPTDIPAGTAASLPAKTAAVVPASSAAEAPANNAAEVPAGNSVEVPASNAAEIPANHAAEVSASNAAEIPASNPDEAPDSNSAAAAANEAAKAPTDDAKPAATEAAKAPAGKAAAKAPASEAARAPTDNAKPAATEAAKAPAGKAAAKAPASKASKVPASPAADGTSPAEPLFANLGLAPALLETLVELGYEQPTPIQARALPPLLAGRDLLGQAQTGTGKTAAFALPALARLNLQQRSPQVLVLTPTRELCIQVAEAFHRYAGKLPGFRVLPVYGGTEYRGQLKALKHGAHVVVGTPGRLMDHMRRGTLDLSALQLVVLDEADEMLRMGFIDDVEWILEQTPAQRQTALFSATLPGPVRRIASRFLKDPEAITIKQEQRTADTIEHRYWLVDGMHKLDALTRILETENFDGMLVFVRTRIETDELSRRLEARGHACAALNGDVPQAQREKIVERFKQGAFDVLVATDVVARGLDVDRISHVVNYDIPHDTEAYVHRVGRTGRAGRKGRAILFVGRRERGMLRSIERATGNAITRMDVPSPEDVNEHRVRRFVERVSTTLAEANDLDLFQDVLERFQHDEGVPMERIAAALASMVQGKRPLLLDPAEEAARSPKFQRSAQRPPHERPPHGGAREHRGERERHNRGDRQAQTDRPPRQQKRRMTEDEMDTFRLEVGHAQGVAARNIVGALTNELGVDSGAIGRITINEDHALVQLPTGMPPEVLKAFRQIWLGGQRLQVSRMDTPPGGGDGAPAGKPAAKPTAKPAGAEADPRPRLHSRDPANRKVRGRPAGGRAPKRQFKRPG